MKSWLLELLQRWFFLPVLSFGVVGCSSSLAHRLVSDQTTPLALFGFSIVPPPGDGWYIARQWDAVVLFKKDAGAQNYETSAWAGPLPVLIDFSSPEEFLAYIRDTHKKEWTEGHIRLLEHAEDLDETRGPYCASYSLQGEEGRFFRKRTVAARGVYCMHPDAPSVLIHVGYAQRARLGTSIPLFAPEASAFVDGLSFRPVD